MKTLNFSGLAETDIKMVLSSWERLNNDEASSIFYRELFNIYPDTKSLFVKFYSVDNDKLLDNPAALRQLRLTWKSITTLVDHLKNGRMDAANKDIVALVALHKKIKTFQGPMFNVYFLIFTIQIPYYLCNSSVPSSPVLYISIGLDATKKTLAKFMIEKYESRQYCTYCRNFKYFLKHEAVDWMCQNYFGHVIGEIGFGTLHGVSLNTCIIIMKMWYSEYCEHMYYCDSLERKLINLIYERKHKKIQ
ncbi:hypothetical protein A3Q56_02503 [Intoshia linei]|uniref:Globin domain-containing protein n=1 Tax=Intoshia linei TaxID=1819745 RepID=A0A177B7S9_9BILA|nr:hypothetical protein A3Q56_02503 [Intoshia linei]